MIFGFLIKYLTEVQISRLFIKTLNMRRRRPSVIWKKKTNTIKQPEKEKKKQFTNCQITNRVDSHKNVMTWTIQQHQKTQKR